MPSSSHPYRHRFVDATPCELPVGKVVCVGRNYAAHARELNNPVPETPILFIKPSTALACLEQPVEIPAEHGECHFETEIAVLIDKPLTGCTQADADAAITGVGVALDLTLRDLQTELKSKGQPWEKAKAFDGACQLSAFLHRQQVADLQQIGIRLHRNGEICQDGNSSDMLNPITALIAYITTFFTLLPGDVVLTGTPAGVGPLAAGDRLQVELPGYLQVETQVVAN